MSVRDGTAQVFVMNADGSGQANRSNVPSQHHKAPAWSPDGSKIAFQTSDAGRAVIDVMNADGSGKIQLTHSPAAQDSGPAWSPDGSKIAYSKEGDSATSSDIYVMNADGSAQTPVTTGAPGYNYDPAWSPDGSKMAFVSKRDGNNEVYVMNANGTGQVNLTNNPTYDDDPAWSPDGSKVAFRSGRDGGAVPGPPSDIYVMSAAGASPRRLTTATGSDGAPAWSPDGSKIAFTSNRDGNSEIYAMNSDGTGQANLSNSPATDDTPDWQTVPRIASMSLPAPDKTAPSVLSLGFVNGTMRAAPKGGSIARARVGATVRYRLSEGATARFSVERVAKGRKRGRKCVAPNAKNRKARRCTRYLPVKGGFSRKSMAGLNSFRFTGRLRGRKLRPGRYRLVLVATDAAGNKSKAKRAAFRVVRR